MSNALLGTVPINDRGVYTDKMKRSLLDKIFFVDEILEPVSALVDFGCADGSLINLVKEIRPGWNCIGYDVSKDMIAMARGRSKASEFFSDWDTLIEYMNENGIIPGSTILNLSSVVHEVYNYCSVPDIKVFWDRVLNSGFGYVAIRDMGFAHNDVAYPDSEKIELLRKEYEKEVRDFESYTGPIKTPQNLVHFLLKYKYKENWEREVKENYFATNETGIDVVFWQNGKYECTYSRRYTLPYIKQQVFLETGIDIPGMTHFQKIFKLKKGVD